jgi:hypothetical protein
VAYGDWRKLAAMTVMLNGWRRIMSAQSIDNGSVAGARQIWCAAKYQYGSAWLLAETRCVMRRRRRRGKVAKISGDIEESGYSAIKKEKTSMLMAAA